MIQNPLDSENMIAHIRAFPAQLLDAITIIRKQPPETFACDSVEHVIVAGMGGSAIAADLAAALLRAKLKCPITILRDYTLPGWANSRTLVIASSYSGGTEETLSVWQAAGQSGCQRLAITTGGRLAHLAEQQHAPVIAFHYQAQPRAALGYSLGLLLGFLARSCLADLSLEELGQAIERLEQHSESIEQHGLELAPRLADSLPLILAAEHLVPVARRWVTQINENAKSWALFNEYPELNHNFIVGLPHPALPAAGRYAAMIGVIQFESPHYHSQTRRRMAITSELIQAQGFAVTGLSARSKACRLDELLELAHLGDFISAGLANHYREDPTPVEAIQRLKRALAEPESL